MSFTKKSTFKPAKYKSTGYSFTPRKTHFTEIEDEIATKGGEDEVKIDLARLDTILTDLRDNHNRHINELDAATRDKFKQVVSYVQLLFDTEYFPILHDRVKSKFADINDAAPGTVAAYFVGCVINSTLPSGVPKSCSVTCAGSMPLPNREGNEWTSCENTVIWALYDQNRYTFTVLNKADNSDRALIYVNHTTMSSFQGFTDEEKGQLSEMGIKDINMLGYSPDRKRYFDLTNSWVPLTQIKSRVSVVPTLSYNQNYGTGYNVTSAMGSPTTNSNTAFILLLVIIVLVILFFLWRLGRVD